MKVQSSSQYNPARKININNQQKRKQQNFKGGISDGVFNALNGFFGVLDKNAMIQVSFVDTISTNIPRTLVDLGTGLAAAFETFRREFSGLFVNCLMPGLIVKGFARILPKNNDIKGTNVVSSWANSDSIEKLKGVYEKSSGNNIKEKTKHYVKNALDSIEGLDGKKWIKYSDKANTLEYNEAIENITQSVFKQGSERKELLKNAQKKLANVTKAENILKFNGKPHSNLEETLRDVADLGSKFNKVSEKVLNKSGELADSELKTKINESIENYTKSLNKFVNKKSLIGMLVVIGIAVSVQTINRAITRKQFKAEGAPIYKDFGKKDTSQKMDEKQKKKFFGKKLLAASGMYGLAALSMMKKPTLGMFQFSGIFPTMDQCRWIASSTFASRMMGAEDDNELRETVVRDIASFSGLYFLGDYVKKGTASIIEAFSKTKKGSKVIGEKVVLLNRKKEVIKPIKDKSQSVVKNISSQAQYRVKQFGNWIKNTELKTASEVSSIKVRNLRNICRVADIAFSIIMLGVILPKYNRRVTEKKVEAAKKQEESKTIKKETPNVFKEVELT